MSENEKTEKLEYQTEEKIEGLTEPIEGEKDIESPSLRKGKRWTAGVRPSASAASLRAAALRCLMSTSCSSSLR